MYNKVNSLVKDCIEVYRFAVNDGIVNPKQYALDNLDLTIPSHVEAAKIGARQIDAIEAALARADAWIAENM